MDAALTEFGARGYTEASIDDIAARAGVTKGAVYYYFTDKSDLARDLQAMLADRLAAGAMATIDPAADTPTNLINGFDAWLRALAVHEQARFFLRDCWAINEVAESRLEGWVQPIRAMLADGMDRGELIRLDADALARVLLGAWSEATLHILQTGVPDSTVEVVRHLVSSLAASHRPDARVRT